MGPVADYLPPVHLMKPRSGLPYWLVGGTEPCGACTHAYVVQMEYRCTGCDRGFCGECVVFVVEKQEILCEECRAAGEEN
jgi:hypothetical protein